MSNPRSANRAPASLPYLPHPLLEAVPGLVHGFGLRGWEAGDAEKAWPGFRLIELEQIHSDILRFVEAPPERRLRGDALATDRPGLLLAIRTADCLPLLIADTERRVAAAVHAGWRGTSLGIAARAVRGLGERYGSRPEALVAALGPCIGPACYEVGEDVRAEFIRAGAGTAAFVTRPADAGGPGTPGAEGAASGRKYLLDLRAANRAQFAAAGVPPAAVVDAGACTHCDARLLSYRRDRDTTARLYNVIGLRNP